jgi:glycosyltransferase involved in cell wall biosynthesis
MSVGCSIVASDNTSVREFIADDINGTIVDFFDVPGLVRACVNTITDRPLSKKYGVLARRKIVAEYDLESIILPKLSRILREI